MMREQPFLFGGSVWLQVWDGNPTAAALYDRHYSRNRNAIGDPRFAGPGEKIVLLTPCARALLSAGRLAQVRHHEDPPPAGAGVLPVTATLHVIPDPKERALWHLEIGYFDDSCRVPVAVVYTEGDDYDDDDGWGCTHCGGLGWAEVEDPLWDDCDEFGYGECSSCHGTGERRHQTVF